MSISPECYILLHSVTDRRELVAGETIFHEGQSGDLMYVVTDGALTVTLHGNEINSLSAGDVFGEMALVDDRPRSATVTATTASSLIPIDRPLFSALVQQQPDFAVQVMNIMSTRMRRSMDEEVKKLRLEQELAFGHDIQLSLLPESSPQIPGWEFATYYQAARQVGGDLFDFIVGSPDQYSLSIVIADVTGKGVPAALFMAATRTMIRAETRNGHGPAGVLQNTNQLLLSDSRSPLFLTAFYASLDTRDGRLRYASAGHEPAFWLCGATGKVHELQSQGMLLGAFAGVPLEEKSMTLAPGDSLVFYTDGVTEAHNADDLFFDGERAQAAVAAAHGGSANEILANLVTAVSDFTGDEPQADDLTVVVVRRVPLGVPAT